MGYAANSIKTVEQWNRYYQEALRVEESWPAGKHFKLKKMASAALADLGTTTQVTSRAVAVIEILVCQLWQPKTRISSVKELLR